ncbi:MAG TPA: nucleoside triphosphate pyrophosphohydrolase [Ktedonobacterales bacterium]|jgi:tetrapyrrole methylase family protein/MazG family protein
MAAEIVILGLGPGRWEDLTLEAQAALETAASAGQIIYFRTLRHPTVEAIQARYPKLAARSFDALYEQSETWDSLYTEMARQVCTAATAAEQHHGQVIYAVPGHPLVGERSASIVRRLAAEQGIATRLVAGLSFLEPVCAALGVDPMDGLQVLDATELAGMGPERVTAAVIPTRPALVAQVYNRRLASGVKLALGELYPDDWEAQLVRAAGMPGDEAVVSLKLYELDRGDHADHLTCLYLPPLDPLTPLRAPETLRYITQRLRGPDGCPWDKKQTHHSLKRYVLEEAYEVADVLDEIGPTPLPDEFTPETVAPELGLKLANELGDLLLQVYLHAEVGRQEGLFTLGDVLEEVNAKLIRRHPHVFGDVAAPTAEHVLRNWEEIKRRERRENGEDTQAESLLHGIPIHTPALAYAQELQKKAVKTGFEWPQVEDILAKVTEEAREVGEAIESGESDHQAEELGDLFFSLVGLARRLHVDAEETLRAANKKFERRFAAMEARVRAQGRAFESLARAELIALWREVKGASDAAGD